jgi:muramoyltetrapeptide carboxypeptidase LdcA involved in peptidoglycan recycling
VFMAKHLLKDFKTSLFTKYGPHWFWLFTKLKSTSKGQRFQDTKAIERSLITATLKVISKDEFDKCFWQWQDRWAKSTAAKGDYFEGNLSHSVVSIQQYLQ